MPPSTTDLDRYVMHLNHALAMEAALVDHLEKRAAAVHQPELKQRLLAHRDESVQHRNALHDIVTSLRAEPTTAAASVQPPVATGLAGRVLAALQSEAEDRLLDDSLADYALEQYEAALYGALTQIARNLGYGAHAGRFEAIRQQERAMAEFLATHQPAIVREAFPPEAQAA